FQTPPFYPYASFLSTVQQSPPPPPTVPMPSTRINHAFIIGDNNNNKNRNTSDFPGAPVHHSAHNAMFAASPPYTGSPNPRLLPPCSSRTPPPPPLPI
ncbi:hypothetical protein IscW_ISCW021876, partial [Ixodes scapularis]